MAKYVCPKHDDVTLCEDSENQSSSVLGLNATKVHPPKRYEKCDEYYFKEQCTKIE